MLELFSELGLPRKWELADVPAGSCAISLRSDGAGSEGSVACSVLRTTRPTPGRVSTRPSSSSFLKPLAGCASGDTNSVETAASERELVAWF